MNALRRLGADFATNYLYPMQKTLFFFAAALGSLALGAQSLVVTSMDSVAYANSHNMTQATAHIAVKNTSAATKDYQVIRRKVGTTGIVDSNYFCWDLCYPTWANQSQGTVTIAPNGVANDFSGYAYVRDTSANGQDTIWYTFVNVADPNDSLQARVVFAMNRYVATPESMLPVLRLAPQPAQAGQWVSGIPVDVQKVEWLDALGRVARREESVVNGAVRAPEAPGLWLLRSYHAGGVRTTKVTVR